jgi:chlorophyllide a oxygenase
VPSPRARAATPDMFVCESLDSPGRFLPIGVQDGLVMVWPGTCRPSASLPVTFRPPEGYTTHAELIIECVPVEHGLLMENLLDLAHAPFTHTGTFAKGWGVPNFVEFVSKQMRKPGDGWHDMANALANAGGKNAPVSVKKLIGMNGDLEGQQGSWNPYPIDMKFVTPCMVDSHIGMSQAGAAGGGAQFEEGVQCAECSNHLHQLHVCAPAAPGTTRLLYRMSLDFAGWAKYVPGIELVWTEMANQVLGEDLRLVTGQQDRMQRGGRVWAHPVAYDKLGLVYRRWRNFSVGDACPMPESDEN